MTPRALALALFFSCAAFSPVHARQAPVPPAQAAAYLGGRLTAADSGQPVRRATVRVASTSPRLSRTTTTDGEGRWSFPDLPAGDYTLSASRPGFLDMVYGANRPGGSVAGTPVRLAPGQRLDNLAFELPRGGVIAGIVLDEFGDPAFNVPVRALRFSWRAGERVVTTAGTATTDDLGAYRLAGLLPGDYLVTAVPRDTVAQAAAVAESAAQREAELLRMAAQAGSAEARATLEAIRFPEAPSPTGYVAVYHPGVAMASAATTVTVGLSQQVYGVDVRLQVVETGTVSGTVLSADGAPIQGNVALIDPAMPISSVGVWFRSTRPDGSFSFPGVVPGSYVVRAHNSPPGEIGSPPRAGGVFQMSLPVGVAVGGGTGATLLRMQPGLTVSGRLDLSAVSAPIDRSRLRVSLLPVLTSSDWEMPPYRVTPDAEGRFTMADVIPARYRVDVSGLPDGWRLASAIFGERDAADYHLAVEPDGQYAGGVLTVTARPGSIAGTLTNALGAGVARHSVVLFPAVRDLWVPQSRRIHAVETGPDGRYLFGNLPAGEYRVAVVADLEPGRQFDPGLLARLLPAAAAVTLGAGEARTQDLRIR